MQLGGDIVAGPAGAGQALRALVDAPAFRALDAVTQQELAGAVENVAGYLESDPAAAFADPYATGLAGPSIRDRMVQGAGPASPAGRPPGQPLPAPPPPGGAPASGGGGGGTVGRVGEVTRATLNAIDFPQFVASLIQGTFKAIVDASIQQMEAYAALLKNVSATVDQFMDDNITDGMAKDHLTTEHPWLFKSDTSKGTPQLAVDRAADRPMPSFLKDLGFDSPAQLDKNTVQQVVVPATRRSLSEQRQQTLATMVLMGINRVVVDDGEIKAKLVFHIDASETTAIKFDQQKATTGNMAGQAGTGMFNAQALMVNTASVNAQSDINVRADLTGEVRVKFRSETFPLERFADSAAIQLINSNAKVPERPAPAAAPAGAPGAPGAPAGPGAQQQPLPPPPPPPLPPARGPAAPPSNGSVLPASGQQGLAAKDPWMP